ncbi:MAG: prepilin-type N-terminal cleavage/methylation domain-containing protein [Chloroflexi bacterium]|nr:prepilin-type N-terminal cleavage/methylation domain-containing protein [Chloroflexota bacterium]
MLDALRNPVGRTLRDPRGFTLIELLVVVGIIVALAAVVVPQIVRFSDRGDQGASRAEWDAIQGAIETLMSDQGLTTVTAGGSAAFITNSFDLDAGSGVKNLANYMRDVTTAYCYTWDASGQLLTQVAATGSPAACP